MSKVAIVRSNSFLYDPMLPKIVRSLSRKYCTSLLGWNREGFGKKSMEIKTLKDKLNTEFPGSRVHILDLGGPAGTSIVLLYYPIFWGWIFLQLCVQRPHIVHACDLDTFIPCYIYRILSRSKMIFYIHDRFAMAFIPQKRKFLYWLVNSLEEKFACKADVFITVGKRLMNTFKRKPKNNKVIMNCCEDVAGPNERSFNSILTIAFTGHISKSRGLENVLSVVEGLDGIELIAAGKVGDRDLLDQIEHTKNAKYVGLLTPAEALNLESRCDVMIALYDLHAAQDEFALPLKLWESMMFGIPLITNVAREIVTEADCGIFVNYNDRAEIGNAIAVLRDNHPLRLKLGNNGRKAFVEAYNWHKMEESLYAIYDDLLRK